MYNDFVDNETEVVTILFNRVVMVVNEKQLGGIESTLLGVWEKGE